MLSPSARRQAKLVAHRIGWMSRTYGVERLLVVHLTTVEPWDWKRWCRQFNNLWSKKLSRHYLDYILVPELSSSGRLHGHAVFAAKADIRTGYDWAARKLAKKRGPKARWRTGANPALRREMARWASGRQDPDTGALSGTGAQLAYGFGYTRCEPVENGTALAWYLSKYMSKGFAERTPEMKGRRLIRCSARVAEIDVPKVGVGYWLWKEKLAKLLKLNSIPDVAALRSKAGPRWAWDLGPAIWGMVLDRYETVRWQDIAGKWVEVCAADVAAREGESWGFNDENKPPRTCNEIHFTGDRGVVKNRCLRWHLKGEPMVEFNYLCVVSDFVDAFTNADGTARQAPKIPEHWRDIQEVTVHRVMGNGPGNLWGGKNYPTEIPKITKTIVRNELRRPVMQTLLDLH